MSSLNVSSNTFGTFHPTLSTFEYPVPPSKTPQEESSVRESFSFHSTEHQLLLSQHPGRTLESLYFSLSCLCCLRKVDPCRVECMKQHHEVIDVHGPGSLLTESRLLQNTLNLLADAEVCWYFHIVYGAMNSVVLF